jgi:hypothetical protein
MKDYKGIYHGTTSTTNYYEFGAHFQYLELYNALNKLKKERAENIPLNDDSLLKLENKEEKEPSKKRKKFKLKTLDIKGIKESKKYLGLETDINEKSKEKGKNKFSTIEEEQENNIKENRRKKSRLLTKSLDKIVLPKIKIKNLNNEDNSKDKILSPIKLLDEKKDKNNYQIGRMSKSLDLKKKSAIEKKDNFPKINSNYFRDIIIEEKDNKEMVEETQSRFKDNNESIKIFNNNEDNNIRKGKILKKLSTRRMERVSLINNEQEKNFELLPKSSIKFDRLKSIFEKEKEIKRINLFLGQKNNYSTNNRNLMNEEMAQQIHNLKMQILSNPGGK